MVVEAFLAQQRVIFGRIQHGIANELAVMHQHPAAFRGAFVVPVDHCRPAVLPGGVVALIFSERHRRVQFFAGIGGGKHLVLDH